MQKINPFLWYDHQAEEAAKFYTSIFNNSKITKVARYPEGSPAPAGSVMTVEFELDGREFVAMNAGPHFKFTEAISFAINCEGQDEVDYFWNKLLEGGGVESQCGWLKDRFGLSWQVTPTILPKLMTESDPETAKRVMGAMLHMKKIDVSALERAAQQA